MLVLYIHIYTYTHIPCKYILLSPFSSDDLKIFLIERTLFSIFPFKKNPQYHVA